MNIKEILKIYLRFKDIKSKETIFYKEYIITYLSSVIYYIVNKPKTIELNINSTGNTILLYDFRSNRYGYDNCVQIPIYAAQYYVSRIGELL